MALTRSQQMARIRGRDTAPERALRSALWAAGMRYRLHFRTPVARPDVVFPGRRVAVFIDGCFWHGCPRHYVRPRSREAFWRAKLTTNVERDRRQTLELEARGWVVVRVWEHEVFEEIDRIVPRIRRALDHGLADHDDWRVVGVESLDEPTKLERRHLVRLRDPAARRTEEGRRITAKWKRSTR